MDQYTEIWTNQEYTAGELTDMIKVFFTPEDKFSGVNLTDFEPSSYSSDIRFMITVIYVKEDDTGEYLYLDEIKKGLIKTVIPDAQFLDHPLSKKQELLSKTTEVIIS